MLVSELRVPIIMPNGAAFSSVCFVELLRCAGVKFAQELLHRHGIRRPARHEMVVIGQHRPGFDMPVGPVRQAEQRPFKQIEPVSTIKESCLVKCAGGNHIDAVFTEPVNRCVWPIFRRAFPSVVSQDRGFHRKAVWRRRQILIYAAWLTNQPRSPSKIRATSPLLRFARYMPALTSQRLMRIGAFHEAVNRL